MSGTTGFIVSTRVHRHETPSRPFRIVTMPVGLQQDTVAKFPPVTKGGIAIHYRGGCYMLGNERTETSPQMAYVKISAWASFGLVNDATHSYQKHGLQ